MTVYVIKKTTYITENDKQLGEPNHISKIFDEEKFATAYYNKYLTEPKSLFSIKKSLLSISKTGSNGIKPRTNWWITKSRPLYSTL